jgi:hypothetical protein
MDDSYRRKGLTYHSQTSVPCQAGSWPDHFPAELVYRNGGSKTLPHLCGPATHRQVHVGLDDHEARCQFYEA